MSRRTEELEAEIRRLQDALKDAQDEVLEVSSTNGRLAAQLEENRRALLTAHEDRGNAHAENVVLAKKLESAIAALGDMPTELAAWRRVVGDYLVELRTGSTAGIVLGRRLESELADAGLVLGAEVGIRTDLAGGL